MRRILVTNDDGYFSPGIEALAAALGALLACAAVALLLPIARAARTEPHRILH